MPSAMSLHFESDHPFIAVPLEGETIQDLQIQIAKIVENPYDMMAFDAGYFNGAINLSQLWNALLYIAREGANPSVLFSCDKSKLPEMYQTDRDYGSRRKRSQGRRFNGPDGKALGPGSRDL